MSKVLIIVILLTLLSLLTISCATSTQSLLEEPNKCEVYSGRVEIYTIHFVLFEDGEYFQEDTNCIASLDACGALTMNQKLVVLHKDYLLYRYNSLSHATEGNYIRYLLVPTDYNKCK